MKLAIPAFYGLDQTFTDSTGQPRNCWQSIEAAASKVGIVVPDASFADLPQQNPGAMPTVYQQFDRCRAKGQKILGYVAARDPATLARRDPTADIQKWYQGYTDPQGSLHIDGIYYDIAVLPQDTDRSGQQAFFTNLVNRLHSTYPAGHNFAMLLAGQCPEEWVVQVADYVLMWETDEQPYLNSFVADPPPPPPETNPPGWWADSRYTDKISHTVGLVPNTTEMSTVVTRAKSRNAGLVYVQDISTLVGYPRLPPYFDDEVAALPTEFLPVYAQGDPGTGIGGYDLQSPADRAFAFDYNKSGKPDHLALYRPATGTIWILANTAGQFTPVYAQGDPGNGIGGYDLKSPADRAFAFDYDGSGKLDHLALYRPGTGTIWILRNNGGQFTPVYAQGDPGNGIGGYDLQSPADQVFAFDYNGSGRLDHLVLYRPGTGTIWILANTGGQFTPVYAQGDPGNGIGGYDLKSPADRAFAFDYDGSGKLDHLALYRPGTGTIWILANNGGQFTPVYAQGDPGNGIGGYDLKSSADQVFAFDYNGSGRLDHLALYRPGTGTIWILRNSGGQFTPVYAQGDPGNGIGGYDLKSPADRAFAFDYDGSGKLDHLALYRPGTGTIWILEKR